ncbi:MAG TPA: biotin--[acetyl-CoA-carboxylase] ligase [bacterium]
MDPAEAGRGRDPGAEARLIRAIGPRGAPGAVVAFAAVTSTMDAAHELAAADCPDRTLVWALRQTAGRGRFGRRWESPDGGAYCSIVVRPPRPMEEVSQLSLVAGLAVCEAIEGLLQEPPRIRWPNDVLLGDAKVAGLLVEMRKRSAVVGIGINVSSLPGDLPAGSISLREAGAAGCDPCGAVARTFAAFDARYTQWANEGFSPLRVPLRGRLATLGGMVTVQTGGDVVHGQALDLDEGGRLLLRLESGIQRAFDSGEVTLLR